MNTQPPNPQFLCCELSEEMHEPLAGTAVTAAVWLMLEYTRPWGAQATSDNELPTEVFKWLGEQVSATAGRLQFIRQFRPDADVLTFFVGVNEATKPRLYEFHLGAYEDLLELDIAAVVAGDGRYQPHLVTGQRYFVCTNGKRDRSCAVHGAALYRALAEKLGSAVWMTTHLGGHRFAPTLLSLPDGICYGRVHPQDVAQFVSLRAQGQVWLDKLRGQTAYPAVAQVADYFLRQETGQTAEDAFILRACVAGDGRWQVQFQGQDKTVYDLTITAAEPLSVYANSGSLQLKTVPHYQLIGWQATPDKIV